MCFAPLFPIAGMLLSPMLLLVWITFRVLWIFQLPCFDGLTPPPRPAGFFIAGLLLKVSLRMRLVELAAAMAPFPSHESAPPMRSLRHKPDSYEVTSSQNPQNSQKRKKETKKEKKTAAATAVHLSCSQFHISRLQNIIDGRLTQSRLRVAPPRDWVRLGDGTISCFWKGGY